MFSRLTRASLVIVDMQPGFHSSQQPWLIENISREIRLAKRRREPIVLLRYHGGSEEHKDCWKVDSRIINAIGNYSKVALMTKDVADGSEQVIEGLKKMKEFPVKQIKITGVNTDACVAETVNSLSEKLPLANIIVIADCCHSESADYSRSYTCRSEIARRRNVKRVNINYRPPAVKMT